MTPLLRLILLIVMVLAVYVGMVIVLIRLGVLDAPHAAA